MKNALMLILSVLITMPLAAYDSSTSMNPLELHQAYMSGKEKIAQHKSMVRQQLVKNIGDAIQAGLIGAAMLYSFKLNINYDPESWTSSPWIGRVGCAAVAFLALKELYGIVFQVRPALAELATMEASIDAEYQKQVRYFMLGLPDEDLVEALEEIGANQEVEEAQAAENNN
jgi:hypothetical protein